MENMKNVMDSVAEFLESISGFLDFNLFNLGETHITFGTLVYVIIAVMVLVYVSGKINKIITSRVIKKSNISPGTVQSIATISRYIIMTLGTLVIVQSAGIDLSALSILAGALGVGIGFGLQNITNNFISGLIILFEQPIKVGDRVRVGEVEGDVIKIAARATTVNTNDNITLIIPNSEFINSTVINWSHNDRKVALRFPVGVSYKEDPEKVKSVILEACKAETGILNQPQPEVLFTEFGESSLKFDVRVWTNDYIDRPRILKSRLYYILFKKFKENGIRIPFPQRDIHIKDDSILHTTQTSGTKE